MPAVILACTSLPWMVSRLTFRPNALSASGSSSLRRKASEAGTKSSTRGQCSVVPCARAGARAAARIPAMPPSLTATALPPAPASNLRRWMPVMKTFPATAAFLFARQCLQPKGAQLRGNRSGEYPLGRVHFPAKPSWAITHGIEDWALLAFSLAHLHIHSHQKHLVGSELRPMAGGSPGLGAWDPGHARASLEWLCEHGSGEISGRQFVNGVVFIPCSSSPSTRASLQSDPPPACRWTRDVDGGIFDG